MAKIVKKKPAAKSTSKGTAKTAKKAPVKAAKSVTKKAAPKKAATKVVAKKKVVAKAPAKSSAKTSVKKVEPKAAAKKAESKTPAKKAPVKAPKLTKAEAKKSEKAEKLEKKTTAPAVTPAPVEKSAKKEAKTPVAVAKKAKAKKEKEKKEDSDLDDDFIADDSLISDEIGEYEDELKAVEELDEEIDVEVEWTQEEKDKNDDEIILTDAEGRRYCRARDCDQAAIVDAYCRFHYLLFWKKIQVRKKILADGKLERYVEELTSRYPDKFLDMIRRDLRTEKDFMAAIHELEIDESSQENEFEEDASAYLEEVRGMGEGAGSTVDDDEY